MLVYGDLAATENTRAMLHHIATRLSSVNACPPGIERHARLVAVWIDAGQLLQGIADREFEARGFDESSDTQNAAMALLMAISRAVICSWDGAMDAEMDEAFGVLPRALDVIGSAPIRVKLPEGHAFYALYPEAYREAARRLDAGLDFRVIGLRSIGAGLSAIVAAALRAPDPITLRPIGDPFRRRFALGPELVRFIAQNADANWALVDEGPGQSGSSLAAAAEMLMRAGVVESRIHVFCGHDGEPGAAAKPEHMAWWRRAQRHIVPFEDWAVNNRRAGHRLTDWVADLTGEAIAPLQDIGAGQWRALSFPRESDWPPVWPQQERRKYLLRTRSGTWLLKFAGLGEEGQRKFALARMLADAGFTPAVLGLRHGFIVERWLEDAWPLPIVNMARQHIIEQLATYIAFRASRLVTDHARGASLEELRRMTERNLSLAFGECCSHKLDVCFADAGQADVVPVEIDGRLHVWEWLMMADGGLIKTDAIDHHASHDLIGCQDIVWDVAGASAEFDLTSSERTQIIEHIEHATGRCVHRQLLTAMDIAYNAFHLGRCTLAAETVENWPEERTRLLSQVKVYKSRVVSLLSNAGKFR